MNIETAEQAAIAALTLAAQPGIHVLIVCPLAQVSLEVMRWLVGAQANLGGPQVIERHRDALVFANDTRVHVRTRVHPSHWLTLGAPPEPEWGIRLYRDEPTPVFDDDLRFLRGEGV